MLRNQSSTNSLMALLFLGTCGRVGARPQDAPAAPPQVEANSQMSSAKHSYQGPDLNDPKLTLSDDQKTKILEIYDAISLRIQEVSKDSSISLKDKMLRWQQLRDERQRQIEAVIPADRLTAWREMQEQRARQVHVNPIPCPIAPPAQERATSSSPRTVGHNITGYVKRVYDPFAGLDFTYRVSFDNGQEIDSDLQGRTCLTGEYSWNGTVWPAGKSFAIIGGHLAVVGV